MEHSKEFVELVESIMPQVREISVADAQERVKNGATLVDVREDREWLAAHASSAIHMARGVIERDVVHRFPDKNVELILYCGGGYRSALATDNLQKMGYTNVFSMTGGWSAWQEANAPETID
jgi:rhodanese-related sulfurtransferase